MYREKMDLRIKLATLPFTDFSFYKHDYIKDISSQKTTADYKRYMEGEFLHRIIPTLHRTERIQQFDEIGLLLEKFYSFRRITEWTDAGAHPSRFYIHRLQELSHLFLTHRNGRVALKYWESSDEKLNENSIFSAYRGVYKVALWNSMNRILCTDLIVMVYLLSNNMDEEYILRSYHALVYLPDTQLDRVLNKGVAETHLHFSASGQFTLNWQAMMSPNPRSRNQKDVDRHTFVDELTGKRADLQLYTISAAILRLVLASYLQSIQGHNLPLKQSLSNFLRSLNESEGGQEIARLIRMIFDGKNLADEGYSYNQLYSLFEDTKLFLSVEEIHEIHEPTWSMSMTAQDSLSLIFGTSISYTSLENVFLFRAIRYLMKQNDEVFTQLFWQYIRVKNEQFSRSVQRNHIRGLSHFSDHFEKATGAELSTNDLQKWGFLLHHQLQSPHIRKLEVRIKPASGANVQQMKRGLAQKLLNFFKAYKQILNEREFSQPGGFAPQIGIIYHFIKTTDKKNEEKCWFDYDENERNYEKLRFKENQLNYKMEMVSIRELREEVSGLSDYIIGIDAASLETHAEPWVFAPIFQQARNSDTHQLVYKELPQRKIRNLGLTYHVGEDFRHMLTGLRHVDEVIDHLQFRAGDRIGHGMVLGLQTEKWASRNRIVILPRIEYLENLLWVWGICKDGKALTNIDISYLENIILGLAEKIYLSINGISVYSLWKSYQSKFQEEVGIILSCISNQTREKWFEKQQEQEKIWTDEMLAHTYHCKCYLMRMLEPIEIEITSNEERLIEQMQKIVQKKVGKEGIIIETNPTSNSAIGEIEHIFEHYILNLNSRGLSQEQSVESGIMVTINTDDPVVFNTNIDNEFAYIFYSLQEKGYAREDILQWIDHVRDTGLISSFIESRQVSVSDLVAELEEMIKKMNDYLYG